MADFFYLFLFLVLLVVYFIPTIAASNRHHRNTAAIAAINIFLGWSLIGWVVALAWALTTSATAPSAAGAPNAKRCPFCAEDIMAAAIVCKHCGRDLPAAAPRVEQVVLPPAINAPIRRAAPGWRKWVLGTGVIVVGGAFWIIALTGWGRGPMSSDTESDLSKASLADGIERRFSAELSSSGIVVKNLTATAFRRCDLQSGGEPVSEPVVLPARGAAEVGFYRFKAHGQAGTSEDAGAIAGRPLQIDCVDSTGPVRAAVVTIEK